MTTGLRAGAAQIDITPPHPLHLYGYPHVPRSSTGVHDPLLSSSLFLASGSSQQLYIANDVIFIGRDLSARARARISEATGIAVSNILISATHTHSGPVTVSYLSNEADETVPEPDSAYLELLENAIVQAGVAAWEVAQPARIGWGSVRSHGLGTNRRDPGGVADPEIPVMLAQDLATGSPLGCMLVCAMHPTVLHEDSTLISGDFPGLARRQLQDRVLPPGCPVVYHMGASGNQSPRYVTRANTFEEAERLGSLLAGLVEQALKNLTWEEHPLLRGEHVLVDLVPATFPDLQEAREKLAHTRERFERLQAEGAPRQVVRTAECDLFGAEETLTLARAAEEGRLQATRDVVMPAEIQVFRVGALTLVGWPGEVFVEYALALREQHPDTFVITLANSDLQGYIVTPEAEAEGGYEASNAVFAAASGEVLVQATLRLLSRQASEAVPV